MVFIMSRAVIFANGHIPDIGAVPRLLHPEDVFIAADGGTHHLLALGLIPSVIIGDLDSLTEAEIMSSKSAGCKVIQRPRDKDETDLELALHLAVESGTREILVVGALGGRLDQTLGNLSLLTGAGFAGLDIRADDGTESAWFVRTGQEISGNPGDIVSLVPWGKSVSGVTTTGLRWPLSDESLHPDRTRGISNELLGETASISIKSGLLLVIHRRNP
jgi:thiamine pyrophosphokinase